VVGEDLASSPGVQMRPRFSCAQGAGVSVASHEPRATIATDKQKKMKGNPSITNKTTPFL